MRRNVGRMRHRVELRGPVRTSDGALGYDRKDGSLGVFWANVLPVSSSEVFRYQHLEQQISHKVTIRYNPLFKQGTHLIYDERTLYIEAVTDPDERKEFMTLMCREGGNT